MLGVPCLTLRTCSVGGPEVHLIPPQVHQFGGPQAVPVGHQDHRGVPVTPTVSRGGFHQPLDLGFRQVLAGAQVGVGGPCGPDCSVYGGWRDQPEVPFGHALRAPCPDDCSDNGRFMDSSSSLTGQKSLAATHPQMGPLFRLSYLPNAPRCLSKKPSKAPSSRWPDESSVSP